jgi:hypothetical protein
MGGQSTVSIKKPTTVASRGCLSKKSLRATITSGVAVNDDDYDQSYDLQRVQNH